MLVSTQVKQFMWKYLDIVTIWILAVLLFAENFLKFLPTPNSFFLIIFLLTIPGYLLTLSLFENKRNLVSFEWILFSIVFSLAQITLCDISLLFLGISINRNNTLIALLGCMIVFSLIVFFTRNDAFQPWSSWIHKFQSAKFIPRLFPIVILVIIGFFGLLTVILTNHNGEKYTEFAALGIKLDGGTTTTITKNLMALNIMVVNHEQEAKSYHMIVNGEKFKEEIPIGILKDGSKWQYQLPFSAKYRTVEKLTFELYRDDRTQPYRTLIFWFTSE